SPTRSKAVPYMLQFGSVKSWMGRGGISEPRVHFTNSRVNTVYTSLPEGEKPAYDEMRSGTDASAEAHRLIWLLKGKSTPNDNAFNNRMIPVMAISETDRAVSAPILAMIELYNVKYGTHKIEAAFERDLPYFIGARKGKIIKDGKTTNRPGGKKALEAF